MTKCNSVSPALEMEIKTEVKTEGSGISLRPKQEIDAKHEIGREEPGIILKPKQETVTKSAAQIVHEQHGK